MSVTKPGVIIDATPEEINKNEFYDKFKKHIKRNRGKYGLTAGAGVPAAITKLGANGYLGTQVQDSIQNTAGDITRSLDASARYDKVKGDVDAGLSVYKKGDNLLYNPSEENQKLLTADRILQHENIPYLAKTGTSKFVNLLTDVNKDPDKINYIIRNPLKEIGYQKDLTTNSIGAVKDSIVDHINN